MLSRYNVGIISKGHNWCNVVIDEYAYSWSCHDQDKVLIEMQVLLMGVLQHGNVYIAVARTQLVIITTTDIENPRMFKDLITIGMELRQQHPGDLLPGDGTPQDMAKML